MFSLPAKELNGRKNLSPKVASKRSQTLLTESTVEEIVYWECGNTCAADRKRCSSKQRELGQLLDLGGCGFTASEDSSSSNLRLFSLKMVDWPRLLCNRL